jgi:hypothetical protein
MEIAAEAAPGPKKVLDSAVRRATRGGKTIPPDTYTFTFRRIQRRPLENRDHRARKHHAYLGSLPIKTIGLRDGQVQSISAKRILTQETDTVAIINGTALGWTELPSVKDLSVKTHVMFKVYDAIAPGGVEDLGS